MGKTKQVKIIGLSVTKNFGALKATELTFDANNRLTVIKGEVGAGKTTLNRAMRLATQGSSTLKDKNLYGDISVIAQLLDGDTDVFVGCRTNEKTGSLDYFLYSVDEKGKKINNPVIDGKRATPANYLNRLQTALTWRLDELTSESNVVQRNILLELYKKELESEGVYFDKNHPNYTEGIIHEIEVAKQKRNYADMKRKEVGGIADDLAKKGVNYEFRREKRDGSEIEKEISQLQAKITLEETNFAERKKAKLNEIKLEAQDALSDIKDFDKQIKEDNIKLRVHKEALDKAVYFIGVAIQDLNRRKLVIDTLNKNLPKDLPKYHEPIEWKDGKVISKPKKFKDYGVLYDTLQNYKELRNKFKKEKKKPVETNVSELQEQLQEKKKQLKEVIIWNLEADAINSFHDWQERNDEVKAIQKDYYLMLTKINTGVKGLRIAANIDDNDKEDEIFLTYDGSYDKKYFNNPKKEMRKISAYSGTQKPMICLLIQNHLLARKKKTLPYLWIDDIPIDKKTRDLLDRMANDLDLWLFVNWTGDFKTKNLKNGEILIENGKILTK